MGHAARIALAAALCLTSAYAAAQPGKTYRGSKEDQEACTPDVYRLCSEHIPDADRIVSCLKMNKQKLSPACRKVFSENR